jgi:tetratricopeptide (TPR) repeat protein
MRISLCVIVRDEEAMLPACLASVEGAADEIVVVDTGSRDGTLAIARRAGAKVLELPWADDFSAPRNAAARAASGDFVLLLDADERLAPGAARALRAAVRQGGFDLGFLRLHNASRVDAPAAEVLSGAARLGGPGLLPRLVRRTPDLEWRGVVHESVADWWVRRGRRGFAVDADIIHLGAIASVREERGKRERNLRLLARRCAEDPGDANAAGYLAMELYQAGRLEEATAAAERGWERRESQPPERTMRRLATARALCALDAGAPERALESARYAAEREGPHPDCAFLSGCAEELLAARTPEGSPERRACLDAAAGAQRSALELLRGGCELALVAAPSLALLRLGGVLLGLGRPQEALTAFRSATGSGAGPEARWGEAEALLAAGDVNGALRAVLAAMEDGRPDAWAIAAQATHAAGAASEARRFAGLARQRARAGFTTPLRRERFERLEAILRSPPPAPPRP